MNNFGEQINLIINNISQKIGVAADKLYPALRTQARIDGITGTTWCLISLIIIIITTVKLTKWLKPEKDRYGEKCIPVSNYSKITIGTCLIIVAVFIIGINFNSSITALFNPDWYIVNKIIQQLK